MKQGNASKDTLEVVSVGNPFLRAEDAFEMPKLEAEYAGAWSVQKVQHEFNKRAGFTSSLSLERPQ